MMPSSAINGHHDLVPGSVHLVDVDHHMHVEHTGKAGQGDIVLIPQPSDDPRDPLRWSQWKKHQTMAVLFFYGLITAAVSGYTSASIAEIIYLIPYINYNDLSHAAAVATLLAGWGNVFFMPMSNKLGRRFVYLFSLAILIAGQAIYYTMSNRSMYLAQAAISGIGIAPFEALIEISIADIYFAHERGSKLGIYIVSIAGGSFFGPLVGGYISASMGWKWIIKFGMIFLSILWVAMFFFLPETKFIRKKTNSEIVIGMDSEVPSEASDLSKDVLDAGHSKLGGAGMARETTYDVGSTKPMPKWYSAYAPWTVYPGSFGDIIEDTIRPFRVMWYPLIFWTGIVYGSCVCWLSVQAVTVASIFAAPPYLWTSKAIGNLAIGSVIGTILGSIYSGPLTNMWVLRMARRNRGIREPEFRLYALIPGAFLMGGGLIMYGVGAAHGINWVLPAFGMGMIAFGLAIGGAVMMGFIIDCYKEIATQGVTCVIVIRNTMGFAITFGTIDWVENQGLQNTFITMGVLAWAIFMSGIAIILFGKNLRKLTAKSYLKFAATADH